MTKIHQVRQEFGEPFCDVVKGFATMGYSKRATAEILEFNRSYFLQICTRFNLHQHFNKPQREMRPECKGAERRSRKGWPKGKKRPFRPRYTDDYLLGLVTRYPSFSDFRSWAPVDPTTVSRRFKLPWREIVRMAQREVSNDRNRGTQSRGLFPVREDVLHPSPTRMPEETETGQISGMPAWQRVGEETRICHVCGL